MSRNAFRFQKSTTSNVIENIFISVKFHSFLTLKMHVRTAEHITVIGPHGSRAVKNLVLNHAAIDEDFSA